MSNASNTREAATNELRRREYAAIREARAEIDRQTGNINDALIRLEYLLAGDTVHESP